MSGVCAGLSAQSVSENGTEFTSTLTLTATAQLNGTTINCTLNGMVSFGWETIRVCSVSCDPRELGDNITHSNDSGTASVPNGVVVFNGTEILGSVARLICDDGFSPSGPVIRMCVSSGNWSGQSQSCGGVTNYSPWWIPLVVCVCVGVAPFIIVFIMFVCCICHWYRKRIYRGAMNLGQQQEPSQLDGANQHLLKVSREKICYGVMTLDQQLQIDLEPSQSEEANISCRKA